MRGWSAAIDRLATFAAKTAQPGLPGLYPFSTGPAHDIGKRACLWAYDLVQDLAEIEHRLATLQARGAKGTTGTQASFLELFGGDHEKVRELDKRIAERLGFRPSYAVTGQTYSRKVDAQVLATLSGIAQRRRKQPPIGGCCKVGKSWKSRSKRIRSARRPWPTSATRCARNASAVCRGSSSAWNRAGPKRPPRNGWNGRSTTAPTVRLTLPQAFLAVDAILILYENVASGFVIYPQVLAKHLAEELPFMATENILMAATSAGGDRQDLHERIRQHSQAAAAVVKQQGKPNDLLDRLRGDAAFKGVNSTHALDPGPLRRPAPEQVDEFIAEVVAPIRKRYAAALATKGSVRV